MELFEFRCKNQSGKWVTKSEYLEDEAAAQLRARQLVFDEAFSTVKIRSLESRTTKKPRFET